MTHMTPEDNQDEYFDTGPTGRLGFIRDAIAVVGSVSLPVIVIAVTVWLVVRMITRFQQ